MKQKTIYTIGYEDATVEALVHKLEEAGIQVLIDVRAIPQSRKPGLSRTRLAARLAGSGIARKQPSCLLCFEHAPRLCHRSVVADDIAEKTGMKIVHLDPVNG